MKQLTGELFHLSGGKIALIYNEQDTRLYVGEKVVFEKKVYKVSAIVPSSRPDGKWSIIIDEVISSQSPFRRLCKCFSIPEGSPCVQGEVYEWTWCIDGKIVFLDSGDTWAEGDFEFFKYFAILTDWS